MFIFAEWLQARFFLHPFLVMLFFSSKHLHPSFSEDTSSLPEYGKIHYEEPKRTDLI